MRFSIFITLIITVTFLVSCEEDPTSVGSDLLPGDDLIEFIEIDSHVENLTQESSTYQTDILLGQSNRVLIGKANDITATSLMRFYIPITSSLSTLIDSNKVNILSAQVFLYPDYTFGDSTGNFGFDVYKVNTTWTVDSFTVSDLNTLDYDHINLANEVSYSDTAISFNVDPTLVYNWMLAELDTSLTDPNGFLFVPTENSKRIFGFEAYSLTSSSPTTMLIEYEVPSEEYVDTITATLNSDVHVVEGTLTNSPDNMIILQSGIGVRGALKFDLSTIPENSIINDATLELSYDSLSSVVGTVDLQAIKVYMFDSYTDKTEFDSLGYIVLSRDADKFTGRLTGFVQRWINDSENGGVPNQGIMLQMGDEEDSVNKYFFYGSSSADALLRPRLKIIYSRRQ